MKRVERVWEQKERETVDDTLYVSGRETFKNVGSEEIPTRCHVGPTMRYSALYTTLDSLE